MTMAMEKLIKNLSFKVADIDGKQRTVKAYFAAFNNIDNDGDVLTKGSLNKTIKENGPAGKDIIRHFLNHEFKTNQGVMPLGKIKELGVDSHGGFFVSKISRTQAGNDVYSLYEDGMINQHSMGFMIPEGKSEVKSDARYINEIKLFEVSTITTWAANEQTPTIDVKEQDTAVIKDTVNPYDSLFREPYYYTHNYKADSENIRKLNEVFKLLKF